MRSEASQRMVKRDQAKQLINLNKELSSLEVQATLDSAQINLLQDEVQGLNEQIAVYADQVATPIQPCSDTVDRLTADRDEQQRQKGVNSRLYKDEKAAREVLEQDLVTERARITTLEDDLAIKQARITTLEEDLVAERAHITDLSDKLAANDFLNATTSQVMSVFSQDIPMLSQEVPEDYGSISDVPEVVVDPAADPEEVVVEAADEQEEEVAAPPPKKRKRKEKEDKEPSAPKKKRVRKQKKTSYVFSITEESEFEPSQANATASSNGKFKVKKQMTLQF